MLPGLTAPGGRAPGCGEIMPPGPGNHKVVYHKQFNMGNGLNVLRDLYEFSCGP